MEFKLSKHPILCNYYLTYRCNAKCGFCDIWERPSPYANLETIEKNLIDLKKLKVKVIDYTGGEPLLHRGLPEILALTKKMGFITTVTTNCLLYPKYANKLKGLIDMLHFSLDSIDEEKHNLSRGVNCYSHVMESIKIANSLGERPDIIFTVTKDSVFEIEDVYQKICLPNNLVLILNPVFEYNGLGSESLLNSEELLYIEKFGKKKNVYLNQGFIELRKNGGNQIDSPVCLAASSTLVISPDNKLVLPCYHLGEEGLPIEKSLFETYRSDKAKKLIALEGKLPACQGCTINCYMQPSFMMNVNKYWFAALPSTLKYNFMKGTWKTYVKNLKNTYFLST